MRFVRVAWNESKNAGAFLIFKISPNKRPWMANTLAQALSASTVDWKTLHKQYNPLLHLVRELIGIIPTCDPVLEIWPPGFRTYNLLVPNMFNLPNTLFGKTPFKSSMGLAMYASTNSWRRWWLQNVYQFSSTAIFHFWEGSNCNFTCPGNLAQSSAGEWCDRWYCFEIIGTGNRRGNCCLVICASAPEQDE